MLKTKGGLIVKKKEMTRVRVDGAMIPVTLLEIVDQKVLRHKTKEKDGYCAVVVGSGQKKSGSYLFMTEYCVDESVLGDMLIGSVVGSSLIEGVESLRFEGVSKGKGFQGGMKRYGFGGGPATHGSKFHRALGSTGNRKPRRTHKGKKMAGHMGSEKKTLKSLRVIEVSNIDGVYYVIVKGSVPGSYNSYAQLKIID